MFSLLLSSALVVGAPAAAPSDAWDRIATRSVVVNHSDLVLTDPRHQRRLAHRVAAAIRAVCEEPGRGVRHAQATLECRREAQARTDTQIARIFAKAGVRLADNGGRTDL